jgi:hypothetical protein
VTWRLYKAVNVSVLPCCQFWTDLQRVYKDDFVHNRYLWICRTLSTGQLISLLFRAILQKSPPLLATLTSLRIFLKVVSSVFWSQGGRLGFCAPSVNRFTAKRVYTRIVVVVNAAYFLWISLFLSIDSTTWRFYKAVNDPVTCHCKRWTRFSLVVW